MANRIHELSVRQQLQDPAEAEVWIGAVPERAAPAMELRGRLMGPRCHYASTVEVAYPLRPFVRPPQMPGLCARVVIPEPSLWEPECPFLYQGPLELWDEDRACDQRLLRLGLRTLALGSRGLLLNGRPFTIRGLADDSLAPDDALALRQAGYNTLLVRASADINGCLDQADRLGLFILGHGTDQPDVLAQAALAQGHPSSLGWVLPGKGEQEMHPSMEAEGGQLLGLEVNEPPTEPPAPGVRFLVCAEHLLTDLQGTRLPKIVRLAQALPDKARERELLSIPGVLGWIGNRLVPS